jgi:hypothetical protein
MCGCSWILPTKTLSEYVTLQLYRDYCDVLLASCLSKRYGGAKSHFPDFFTIYFERLE